MWDEITYSFLNFKGATVEVEEWISNFIPHFSGHICLGIYIYIYIYIYMTFYTWIIHIASALTSGMLQYNQYVLYLIAYVLSTSVGSCLHLVTPSPSWIVTSQEVGLVAMSKCKYISKMAAASSVFHVWNYEWFIRWVKLVILLWIDSTLVVDCIFIMIRWLVALYDLMCAFCDVSWVYSDEKFDMLETNTHRWNCGSNFTSLLDYYSESVCIFSVNYDS